jgi:hypothetical protein
VQLPIAAKRWYQKPRLQLGLGAAIVVAVIGAVFWARYTEPPRAWDPDIKSFGRGDRE